MPSVLFVKRIRPLKVAYLFGIKKRHDAFSSEMKITTKPKLGGILYKLSINLKDAIA
jgi:hypothetical protein